MSDWLQLLVFLLVAAAIFALISRAMRKRDERWESEDWRQPDRDSVKFGTPLLEIQSMLEPDRKHQVEETRRARLEEEESGDPPDAGRAEDD
ncbi:MAG: hypothetical protein GKS06_01145 [Acidobacteria bacterium]|nr:hypothetical protein [Acidobacteriota bacterium]